MENIEVVTQKSFNDHDLLLVLHRDVQHITDTLKDLKDTDIKEIKERTAERLQKIEDDYCTETKARQMVDALETETAKVMDDHETRMRSLERKDDQWFGKQSVVAALFSAGVAIFAALLASGLFTHHI